MNAVKCISETPETKQLQAIASVGHEIAERWASPELDHLSASERCYNVVRQMFDVLSDGGMGLPAFYLTPIQTFGVVENPTDKVKWDYNQPLDLSGRGGAEVGPSVREIHKNIYTQYCANKAMAAKELFGG